MNLLTVCVVVRDEEADLPRCLTSVSGVADEVVVVDTGSTDDTKTIARDLGALVYDFPWTDDFAAARNYAIGRATGRWVLMLDADEELHPDDRDQVRPLLQTDVEAYHLPIISFLGAATPAATATVATVPARDFVRDLRLSLFRNRPCYRFKGAIHEELTGDFEPEGTALAPLRILHYGYLDGRMVSKQKGTRNRRLLSKELERRPDDPFLHYCLGAELLGSADYPGALSHFQIALGHWGPTEPRHGDLLAKVALCHLYQGGYREAREVLREGIRLYPDFTDLWFLLGGLEFQAGRTAAGRKCFERCLSLGPAPPRYSSFSGVGGDRAVLGVALTWLELAITAAGCEPEGTDTVATGDNASVEAAATSAATPLLHRLQGMRQSLTDTLARPSRAFGHHQ